jgi:Flp pilus assembly protein TadB
MTDSRQEDPLQALWQSQSRGEPAISIEHVREGARRLERRVARRNRREYIAAVVVVFGYGWILWLVPIATARIGAGLIIAATIFICYRLHVHGSAASLQADVGLTSSLEFYRAQLERQRDLLHSVWRFFLLPFVPGLLVLMIGYSLAQPARVSFAVAYGVLALMLGIGLHALNRRAAARIQGVLDRLKDDI